MREFDGFSGVAAMAGQWGQREGVRAQGDGVIGGNDALIAQAEAAGEIEAAGSESRKRRRRRPGRSVGCSRRRSGRARRWLAAKWWRERGEVR